MSQAVVYLIPSLLDENGLAALPAYITDAVKSCRVVFAENERTARRFFKVLCKEIVIDDYEWHTLSAGAETSARFREKIRQGNRIGIISESGCPGIADPGQELISIAHELNAVVRPLAGPSAILLSLMASGMNGQQFRFVGYIPVKDPERSRTIKELEMESQKKKSTQVFIETPYRNNQLIDALLKNCRPSTKLCIAANLTGPEEWIRTRTIQEWKKEKIDFNKQPCMFCLLA
jgi:16S rRNA (cytidine1402-2'-O)-methyltransferase